MRAAILSDIHSNLEALEAVFAHVADRDVDAVVVLGDIVGYNADPVEVVARLVEHPNTTLIAGNHDMAATGRFDVNFFNTIAATAISWTADVLTPDARALLTALEPRAEIGLGLLVHGSVVEPAIEYVTNANVARASFAAEQFSRCFFGHTHMPACFAQAQDGHVSGSVLADGIARTLEPGARYMLNPGSVGQPRDRDPRASYLIYDQTEATAVVHRVDYDLETTQRKILDAGLPDFLALRLASGR